MFNRRVYLDCAAGIGGNPSSPHLEGLRAKQKLEDARTAIARLVEVQPDDVIFTSGATEANALAILGNFGLTKSQISGLGMSGLRKSSHALYLPSAHASIVENMKLVAERGVEIEALPIMDGQVDCEKLKKLLRPETKLVSMEAVCGETGVIWNTREVAEALRDIVSPSSDDGLTMSKHGRAVLHVDASQAPLTEKITRAHFGVDLLVFDGSKVGVRGVGVLITHLPLSFRREARSITPLYAGGGQERGLRPGTEAPELAQSFAMAIRAAANDRENFRMRALRARISLIDLTRPIGGVLINESRAQAPNILNLSFPGRDTDYLVALLDESGFAVSTRSACETNSEEGSRAVLALTNDRARALSTLRISWGPSVRPRELTRFAKALTQAVAFIDRSGQR